MKKIVLGLLCFASVLSAQEKPVTISGHVIADAYAMVGNHDPSIEGKNGFWIRRVYLGFDRALSDALSARVRFEINQPGDFKTSNTMQPFVKDAFLRWKASPRVDVIAGLSSAPAFETTERLWGYRPIEKAPQDLHRISSSRDLGIAVIGTLGAENRYRYHVMAGNGSGTGSETNEGKYIGGAFSVAPTKTTLVELYADHDSRPGDDDRTTVQALAHVQGTRTRGGVLFTHQMRDSGDIDLASVFGNMDLRKNLTVVGRIDRMFDPNPEGDRIPYLPFDRTSESTLFIAGVDWKLHKNVSILPNLEYVHYDGDLDDDILPRVTLYFSF